MLLYLNQLLLGSFINFIKSILSKAECFLKSEGALPTTIVVVAKASGDGVVARVPIAKTMKLNVLKNRRVPYPRLL